MKVLKDLDLSFGLAANTAGTALLLENPIAATSGNQRYAPALRWTGKGWDSTNSTSKSVDFRGYVIPLQGAGNPTGYLLFESSINGGSFGGGLALFSSGGLALGSTTDPGAGNFSITVAGSETGTALPQLYLQKNTSGTPAQNFGGGIKFRADSTTTANRDVAEVLGRWWVATDASREGYVDIQVYDSSAGSTQFRIFKNGSASLGGLLRKPGTSGIMDAQTGFMVAGSGDEGNALIGNGTYFKDTPLWGVTSHGDSNYTILTTDRVVVTSATFTATRTWTLPSASAVIPGQPLVITDLAGAPNGFRNLIISRAGSDTIEPGGRTTITFLPLQANFSITLRSDGVSKWFIDAFNPGGIINSGAFIQGGTNGTYSQSAYEVPTAAGTSGNIWVSDGTNMVSVAMSGEATIDSTGAVSVSIAGRWDGAVAVSGSDVTTTSTTTLVNITGLQSSTLVNGGIYEFEVNLRVNQSGTGGIIFGIDAGAGAISNFAYSGTATAGTATTGVVICQTATNTGGTAFCTAAINGNMNVRGQFTMTGNQAVFCKFARNSANGTAKVFIGSTFKWRRIA